MKHKYGLLTFLMLTACSQSNTVDKQTVTQLDDLLKKHSSSCKQALLTAGNQLIGQKTHYLQPIIHMDAEKAEQATENTQTTSDDKLSLSGVLIYNDRPSHIRFDAYQQNGACVVSYQLNYQLDIPCLTAREEAFKKWLHTDQLGDKTRAYVHKRHPNKRAYLTNISRDLQCLVSVHHIKKIS